MRLWIVAAFAALCLACFAVEAQAQHFGDEIDFDAPAGSYVLNTAQFQPREAVVSYNERIVPAYVSDQPRLVYSAGFAQCGPSACGPSISGPAWTRASNPRWKFVRGQPLRNVGRVLLIPFRWLFGSR